MSSPWVLLGLAVSVAMLVCTPFLWRSRGAVFGLRWFAISLLPAGLALTGLLTLFGRLTRAIGSFFGGAVFSPRVWVGYALIGAAVVMWLVARAVRSRGSGDGGARRVERGSSPAPSVGKAAAPALGRSRSSASQAEDDEFADIEAILRRRGI